MADLNPGVTIGVNQSVTPDFLEDLADESTVSGIENSDLVSGLVAPYVTGPAIPVQGDAEMNETTGRIDFYNAFVGLQELGLHEQITLTNNTGDTSVTGDLAFVDHTDSWAITVTVNDPLRRHRVIGPIQTSVADGAEAGILIRGFGPMLIHTLSGQAGEAGMWLYAPNPLSPATPLAGAYIIASGSGLGDPRELALSEGGSALFAQLTSSIAASTSTVMEVFVWR